MQPQPPPSAPAPPPSEAAILSQKKRKWIWVVGIPSAILMAGMSIAPLLVRNRCCKTPAGESIRNLQQIGMGLFEFQSEYGDFPAATTIHAVQTATESDIPLGTVTSNDFFGQLFASGMVQSESIFYAQVAGTHKPDDNLTRTEVLRKGECGFTYFLGAKPTDNPSRPLVIAPMIPGTDRFDPKPFKGRAVFLKMDCSVTSLPIDNDGHILIDGRNMMDPHHPIWDSHAPVIAWPDL